MIMVKVQFKGFDTKKLLREIQKDFEKDLERHPDKVLDAHIGEVVEGTCSKCGETTIEILSKGQVKCTQCGLVTEVNIKINYT